MVGFADMFPYKYVDTPLAGLSISAPWHGYHCHRGPLAGQSVTSQERCAKQTLAREGRNQ